MKKRLQKSSSSLQENRYAPLSRCPCAVNASWEADIIILSGFVLMIPNRSKLKNVATAKPLS
jgi:hypothetical protein